MLLSHQWTSTFPALQCFRKLGQKFQKFLAMCIVRIFAISDFRSGEKMPGPWIEHGTSRMLRRRRRCFSLSKSEITTTVWSMKYESVCLTARNRDLASAPVFLSCVTCWKIHAAMSANDPSHSLLSSRCPIPILPRFESPFHEGSLVKLPRQRPRFLSVFATRPRGEGICWLCDRWATTSDTPPVTQSVLLC